MLAPAVIAGDRRRLAPLGLDGVACVRGIDALTELLARRGPLTRSGVEETLAVAGIPLGRRATYHLIRRAVLEGLAVFARKRSGEAGYWYWI